MTKTFLVQTDTTVGFLSKDDKKLAILKERPTSQKILQEVDSFKTLQKFTRIPKRFKNTIRRSKKTTFIYPDGESYRKIESNDSHFNFISKFSSIYSTSANKTKEKFDIEFAMNKTDIQVYSKSGFYEGSGSNIFKISNYKIKKIR